MVLIGDKFRCRPCIGEEFSEPLLTRVFGACKPKIAELPSGITFQYL